MKLEDMIPFAQVLDEQLRDPEFRAEWERLAPPRTVANRLVGYRVDHGLTQTALGRLLGMAQPAIARLETEDHLPTLQTLMKLAEALDLEILVTMAPSTQRQVGSVPELRQARIPENVTIASGASMTIGIR